MVAQDKFLFSLAHHIERGHGPAHDGDPEFHLFTAFTFSEPGNLQKWVAIAQENVSRHNTRSREHKNVSTSRQLPPQDSLESKARNCGCEVGNENNLKRRSIKEGMKLLLFGCMRIQEKEESLFLIFCTEADFRGYLAWYPGRKLISECDEASPGFCCPGAAGAGGGRWGAPRRHRRGSVQPAAGPRPPLARHPGLEAWDSLSLRHWELSFSVATPGSVLCPRRAAQ